MRLLALAALLIISLSGCATTITSDDGGDRTENTSSCTITQNGVTRDCSAPAAIGPRENVTIDARGPLDEGLDRTWQFAVHPGAASGVSFSLHGYDGQQYGVAPDHGCIVFEGPGVRKTQGNCASGNNLQVSVGPGSALIDGETVLFERSGLRPGDYSLSARMPTSAADYHVQIVVVY